MNTLRIFLVDDHHVVREGLRAMLNGQPGLEVVGEAADGAAACDAVLAVHPDVVIMDVSLPGIGGIQAATRLSRECPSAKVIAFTVHEESAYAHRMLAAGARGYLLKQTSRENFVQAIQVVANGGVYLDPSVAGKLVTNLLPNSNESSRTTSELSEREMQIVRHTVAGFGNKEIAARLDLSVKTIETYRARAMDKLGVRGRAELFRHAQRQGWLHDMDVSAN